MTKAKQNSWLVRLCNWYRFWAKSLALAIMIAMAGTMHIEGRNSLILGQANGGGRRRDSRLTTHDCDCTKNHITVTVCQSVKKTATKQMTKSRQGSCALHNCNDTISQECGCVGQQRRSWCMRFCNFSWFWHICLNSRFFFLNSRFFFSLNSRFFSP